MEISALNFIETDSEDDFEVEMKCHPSENMQLSFNNRLQSIVSESSDVQGEIIRKIIFYYNSTGLTTYKDYLVDLISSDQIPFYLKMECLTEMESDHNVLIVLIRGTVDELPITLLIQYVSCLLSGSYRDEMIEIVKEKVLTNPKLRDVYKINTIHSTKIMQDVLSELSKYYITLDDASLYSKLQVCSNTLSCMKNTTLEEFILSVMLSEDNEENSRGHAMDILLQFGSQDGKDKANEYIAKLGRQLISNDSQNVHRHSISDNVKKLYQNLTSRIADVSKIPSFDTVKTTLIEKDKNNVFMDALDYIEGDHIIFDGIHRNLKSCLCLVMGFIEIYGGEKKESLYGRVIEELVESVGTCSTGYLSRIANSLSGFDGYIIGISWEEQIKNNLMGRLNAKIRQDPNSGEILAQMTNYKSEDRTDFFHFMRKNIPAIKEEMYSEFREYMSDSEWDLYMFKAITEYYGTV